MSIPTPVLRWMSIIVFIAAPLAGWAQAADEPIVWRTGEKFRDQLDHKIGVTWENIPLRRAINSLSRSQAVSIILDRRVNPDENIDLSIEDVPLETLIKAIAEKKKIGMGIVGSTVYLGPGATADKIRTLATLRRQEAQQAKGGISGKFLATKSLAWDEATAPRDILTGLATESKVTIQGLDKIPHDLWAAATIPTCSVAERLTLVAAQFDLTFELVDGTTTANLVDIPDKVTIERRFSIPAKLQSQSEQLIKNLSKLAPSAEASVDGATLFVRGKAEDQDLAEVMLSGKTAKKTTVVGGKKVYQLSIVMPVGTLIKTLGKKMELDVQIDEAAIAAAGLSLTKEVTVNVKDVTQDELFAAVLAPAGLTFDHRGAAIAIHPGK